MLPAAATMFSSRLVQENLQTLVALHTQNRQSYEERLLEDLTRPFMLLFTLMRKDCDRVSSSPDKQMDAYSKSLEAIPQWSLDKQRQELARVASAETTLSCSRMLHSYLLCAKSINALALSPEAAEDYMRDNNGKGASDEDIFYGTCGDALKRIADFLLHNLGVMWFYGTSPQEMERMERNYQAFQWHTQQGIQQALKRAVPLPDNHDVAGLWQRVPAPAPTARVEYYSGSSVSAPAAPAPLSLPTKITPFASMGGMTPRVSMTALWGTPAPMPAPAPLAAALAAAPPAAQAPLPPQPPSAAPDPSTAATAESMLATPLRSALKQTRFDPKPAAAAAAVPLKQKKVEDDSSEEEDEEEEAEEDDEDDDKKEEKEAPKHKPKHNNHDQKPYSHYPPPPPPPQQHYYGGGGGSGGYGNPFGGQPQGHHMGAGAGGSGGGGAMPRSPFMSAP